MLTYPQIDPVIIHLGPIQPRWYGLMYLIGFLYAFRLIKKNARWMGLADAEVADSILASLVIGMIVTARIVYVCFYNLPATLEGPWWEAFAIWHGGLAFHGGLLGVMLGAAYSSRKYKFRWARLADVLSLATPVGLGLGRVANFINGELWGRVTDVPWAMVFPGAGPNPRHPSQLYESFLEGPVLVLLLRLIWWRRPRVGVTASVFLLGYAAIRITVEFFREPDVQVGFVLGPFTMGQLLSVTMIAYGSFLLWRSLTRGEAFDATSATKKSKR